MIFISDAMGIGRGAAIWYGMKKNVQRCEKKREEVLRTEFSAPHTVYLKRSQTGLGADIAGFHSWRITRCFSVLREAYSQNLASVPYQNAVPEHIK